MKWIAVFCGAREGADPAYLRAARSFGQALAEAGLGLVYGGSRKGLMGAVADGALAGGGQVVGIIPQGLAQVEGAYTELQDLRVVGSLHERKAQMAELAHAFVALPGGFGTLDEFCEIFTWRMIGLHQKPCVLLNIAEYFSPFLSFIDHAVAQGFVRPEQRRDLWIADAIPELISKLQGQIG